MRKLNFKNIWQRLAGSRPRSRRGSILIMVVAVLVLLALMGTAYMSIARLDRQAAGPANDSTTDEVIEQLVPAVSDLVEKTILEDISSTAMGYRPPPAVNSKYDHWDSPISNYRVPAIIGPPLVPANDAWLGSRIPELVGPSVPQLRPSWRAITRPLGQPDLATLPGGGPSSEITFESPWISATTNIQAPSNPAWLQGYGSGAWSVDALTMRVLPADVTITYVNSANAALKDKTRVFPALQLADLNGNPLLDSNNRPYKYVAGDADGDGVADSGLVYMTTVDNVRYYYAVRIVDENSAVNVNTAWSMMGDFGPNEVTPTAVAASVPQGWPNWAFPSSVGLLEMLATYQGGTQNSPEMDQINRFKLNLAAGAILAPIRPVADPADMTQPNSLATDRTDFDYTTQGEAMYEAFQRRMAYPGWREHHTVGTRPTPDTFRYRSFELLRHADLSYHNVMMNPESDLPTSDLEIQLNNLNMADSVYRTTPNWAQTTTSRYRYLPPDKWQYWAMWNFEYVPLARQNNWSVLLGPTGDAGAGGTPPTAFAPLRALLTPENGVSNFMLKHAVPGGDVAHASMLPYRNRGRWDIKEATSPKYVAGDIVTHSYLPVPPLPGPGFPYGVTKLFYCIKNDASGPPATEPQLDTTSTYWAPLVGRGPWLTAAELGAFGGVAYVKGNVVMADNPATPAVYERELYVCYENGAAGTPPAVDTTHWRKLPAGGVPPKTSLNTAPFEELFRGFWNVMASNVTTENSPFDGAISTGAGSISDPAFAGNVSADPRVPAGSFVGTFDDPYVGSRFEDYNYIAGGATPGPAPFAPNIVANAHGPGEHPGRMFRSSIRALPDAAGDFPPATARLPADQMVLLRAAIAAVNAEDMRDADGNITAREVMLTALADADADGDLDAVPTSTVVYGHEPQPYITEVYVNTDTQLVSGAANGQNPNGYVAIELYNPYPFPISLNNWVIAAIDRTNTASPTAMDMFTLADNATAGDMTETYPVAGTTGAALTIEPYGYMILENYTFGAVPPPLTGGHALYRPRSLGLPQDGPPLLPAGVPPVKIVFVPGLGDTGTGVAPYPPAPRTVTNREMVILRPRLADGTLTAAGIYPSGMVYDETAANLERERDLVPVDSYDFSGLILNLGAGLNAEARHYVRPNQTGAGRGFHFVYPGRYDAGNTSATAWNPVGPRARQSGTQQTPPWPMDPIASGDTWDTGIMNPPGGAVGTADDHLGPWMSFGYVFTEGTPDYIPPVPPLEGSSSARASFGVQPSRPIQLSNAHFLPAPVNGSFIGHNAVVGPTGNQFPFGGFMRNGDVLHVPFIGAYRIFAPTVGVAPGTLLEINPVTMDSAMAEDCNLDNDGRVLVTGLYNEYIEQIGRFCPGWDTLAQPSAFTYDWATDVLDQFTAIQNYHDDFLPNTDPARYPAGPTVTPMPMANSPNVRPNTDKDRDAPVQGLINVNTAPARVLAALPLVVNADGSTNVAKSEELARAIVFYRDVNDGSAAPGPHGPFKSLFELNDVVATGGNDGFYNMMGQWVLAPIPSGASANGQGDFTPFAPQILGAQPIDDNVKQDYEERYLNLMRLSNLLTTRSDVFKAYVLVQGWTDTGTQYPQLVAERRAAFIVDRSRASSDNTAISTYAVPTR